jgi:di/tricarboxylate transporter
MSAAAQSLLILAITVALFVWNRLPVEVVAVGCALTLLFAGLIDNATVFSGFGDPVIIFIAALFIVSEGLEASGVTAWISAQLSRFGGGTYRQMLLTVMLLGALVSAVITVNGAAAALLPVTVALARSAGTAPSRVLIPLAFACSAGALLTLTGSPVNVLIHETSKDAGGGGFGFFEFALIGVPLVLATLGVCVLLGSRLLPDRTPTLAPADLTDYRRTLAEHWTTDYRLWRLTVPDDQPASGASAAALVAGTELALVGVQTEAGRVAGSDDVLGAGDSFVVAGVPARVRAFAESQALSASEVPRIGHDNAINRDSGVAEVVIPPRSEWLDRRVFPGMTGADGLTVLSVRRRNADRGTQTTDIEPGDMLLVQGRWATIDRLDERDVLVVESADAVRRQIVPLGPKAPWAIGILLAMVAVMAAGLMPAAVAAVLAAGAMVLTRVVRLERCYRAIPWQTLILIGGLIPLSSAISSSGAADAIARPILDTAAGSHPVVVLALLFVLTAVLGQFISNVATVLVVIPIALSIATESGLSVQPVLMTVAVAGAAALLTPIATPANLIVMNPGGYRFGDYWRLGWVLMVTWMMLALLLIPAFWPLQG